MSSIRAIRYHDICAGHRVYGHESKCAHIHGHNYRIHFHCEIINTKQPSRELGIDHGSQQLDQLGRVIDFSVIKSTLCEWLENEWDHKFLVWENDPLHSYLQEVDPAGVVVVPFNPTAEHIAKHLVEVVAPRLLHGTGVTLMECVVEETRKCSANYHV